MKRTELQPNCENLVNCIEEDRIGRNREIAYFVKLLNAVEGAYSIAIDGRWGSGKTFFVKLAKLILDAYNPHSQIVSGVSEENRAQIKACLSVLQKDDRMNLDANPTVCVYFDAWEHDRDESPIASLLYSITLTTNSEYAFKGNRDFAGALLSLVDDLSGKSVKDIVNALKSKNITDAAKEQSELQQRITEYFDSLLLEHGNRLVIFIDELDRCNPSYAVKLLEEIKHYFADDKITFVFSVNLEQLQYTVKQHYGGEFDAHKYMERFFDLIIPMPQANLQRFYQCIDADMGLYTNIVANLVVMQYHMEMREIAKYFSALKIATRKSPNTMFASGGMQFCHIAMIPIAIGLHKTDVNLYNAFISGQNSAPLENVALHEDMSDVLNKFFYDIGENIEMLSDNDKRERISAVYNALFDAKVSGGKSKKVGRITFSEIDYRYFMNMIGMLNESSTYDESI